MAASSNDFHLGNTLGMAFLGNIAAAVLYGITSIQTSTYSRQNGQDKIVMKSLVFFLWVLDGLHLALITHTLYTRTINDFGNPMALATPTWSITAHVLVAALDDVIVRGLFCRRVWKLSGRNLLLMACIVLSSLLSFAGLLACTIKGFAFHSFSDFANSSVGLGAAAFADVLIATSLCVLLRRCRTGFSRTDSVVRTLIVYSVNTGALTSLCAIASLVTYAVMPDSYVFLAIYFVLPELLLNSLLATLNARSSLRERNAGSLVPISLSNQADSQTMSSGKPGQSSGEEVVCHVTNVSV